MEDYRYFLNEGANISIEDVRGFIEAMGVPETQAVKSKTESYIQKGTKKKKIFIYTADRLTTKDKLQNILKANRARFKEVHTSDSSLKVTVVGKGKDEVTIVYKPTKGTGGSGAGADQTALQEIAQAIFLSMSFNVKRSKLKAGDINKDSLTEAYQFVDTNDFPIMEILAMTEDKKWMDTFLKTTNMIYSKYFESSKSYTFERGSEMISRLYNDFRDHAKDLKLKAQNDKWNPADIWMISTTLKDVPKSDSLNDLNSFVRENFESRDLIGISLKKLSSSPKISVLNIDSGKNDEGFKGYTLSPKSKDVYINTTGGGKIQFRSFNNLGGYQGEIIGKSAKHGKIGFSMLNYFLSKNGNSKLPDAQVEVKEDILDQNAETMGKFVAMWNKYIKQEFATSEDVVSYANSISKNPEDWMFSKYISLLIVDTLNEMTDQHKDELVQDVFGFASSNTDFSSVFLKVS